MTQENTEFYIFTGHGNQEENGTSDFGKPCSIFDHIQNQGAEAVVSITSGQTPQDAGMASSPPEHNQSVSFQFLTLTPISPS